VRASANPSTEIDIEKCSTTILASRDNDLRGKREVVVVIFDGGQDKKTNWQLYKIDSFEYFVFYR
jgi:hypothetical protein